MTDPERTALYVTDAEIIRRWGIGEKNGWAAIRQLERNRAFPQKDPLFSNRRYWPAVKAFMDSRAGLTMPAVTTLDGEEHLDAKPAKDRRRAGPVLATSR